MFSNVSARHEGFVPYYAGGAVAGVALNPARRVSLKTANWVTVVVTVTNSASAITGRAVTLKQSTNVAGAGAKVLAFNRMWANTDCAGGFAPVDTVVSSNTFTTDTTVSKDLSYVIEVDTASLDVANSFDCFAVDVTAGANSIVSVVYYIGVKYGGPTPPSMLVD
jgi:hypothetical protein